MTPTAFFALICLTICLLGLWHAWQVWRDRARQRYPRATLDAEALERFRRSCE